MSSAPTPPWNYIFVVTRVFVKAGSSAPFAPALMRQPYFAFFNSAKIASPIWVVDTVEVAEPLMSAVRRP